MNLEPNDRESEAPDRWPPLVSAHRLFTLGIVLTVVGVLVGSYLAAVLEVLREFMGVPGRIGYEIAAAILVLVGSVALPFGVVFVGAALIIRRIEGLAR